MILYFTNRRSNLGRLPCLYLVLKGVNIYLANYQLKAKVMALGVDSDYKRVSKAKYAYNALLEDGVIVKGVVPIDYALKLEADYLENEPELWQEAGRLNWNSYKRISRLKRKIANMIDKGQCLFLTLTFTDEALQNTKAETRRQKVRRFLSSYNCEYVANIDYGRKKEREHYHAIIQTKRVDHKKWCYGALDFKRIAKTSDSIKLAKYITKLTNHALKATTKQCRVIYDRLKQET